VTADLGSAGCQPAPPGSLPGGIFNGYWNNLVTDVCGKLPQTAG
jgi:hypothetical protein